MAFNINHFSLIGGQSTRGRAPQMFAYKTSEDTDTEVRGADYFNQIAEKLEVGDFIFITATNTSNEVQTAKVHVVTGITNGTVTISTGQSISPPVTGQ